MAVVNKNELVEKYLKDTNIIYYDADFKEINAYNYNIDKTIKHNWLAEDFINNYLWHYKGETLDYDDILSWIVDIERVEVSDASSPRVDSNDFKLMNSYKVFHKYIDINEKNDLSISQNIKKWQLEAYNKLFEEVKQDFISFLEEKVEELENMEIEEEEEEEEENKNNN